MPKSKSTFTAAKKKKKLLNVIKKQLQWPDHITKASGTCLFGKSLIKIGFQIASGFMEVYEVCHDLKLSHTYYTKFTLGRDAAGAQTGVQRSDWIQGAYFTY